MEDLLGKAFERLIEARSRIEDQCQEYADRYGPWAFIAVLTLSALFGWD